MEVGAGVDELLSFRSEEHGVEHHAVADNVDVALEHARGDRAQHYFAAIEFERMAGIGSALEACHHVVARSEHVYYFTFTFVAPLEA